MPGAEGRRPAGEDALNVQHTGAGSSLRSVLSYVSYSQTCGNAESEKKYVYVYIYERERETESEGGREGGGKGGRGRETERGREGGRERENESGRLVCILARTSLCKLCTSKKHCRYFDDIEG